jgi:uncharacterized protein YkwD
VTLRFEHGSVRRIGLIPHTRAIKSILTIAVGLIVAGCSSTSSSLYVRTPDAEDDEKTSTTSLRCQIPDNEDELVIVLFERIQHERETEGLPPLVLDDTLSIVAEQYACKMVDDGFFDHVDPETQSSPGQRVTEAGYSFVSVGENLAAGQRTVEDVVEQWMESDGHRANILGVAWRETGIAVRTGGEYGVYWVQIFADPLDLDRFAGVPLIKNETP